jgi:hypothetical protein
MICVARSRRTLGVTYKTAWSLTHRIREAMRSGSFISMGRHGGALETDETFIAWQSSTFATTIALRRK